MVKVSVVIVTHNHERYIRDCLNSVLENNPYEIIVVDNSSKDRSTEIVKEFPEVKLIENKENIGYGRGNNLGVKHSKGKYVVILNPDTKVEKNWLEELLKPLKKEKKLITTPKILMYDGAKINTCGNIKHFTGLAFTRGLNEKPERFNMFEYVNAFSGACFAMRKKEYLELGGFDENFFNYMEDVEFSWRAYVNGFKILYIPTSIVYHDYRLEVLPKKIYHLEKGEIYDFKEISALERHFIAIPFTINDRNTHLGICFFKWCRRG